MISRGRAYEALAELLCAAVAANPNHGRIAAPHMLQRYLRGVREWRGDGSFGMDNASDGYASSVAECAGGPQSASSSYKPAEYTFLDEPRRSGLDGGQLACIARAVAHRAGLAAAYAVSELARVAMDAGQWVPFRDGARRERRARRRLASRASRRVLPVAAFARRR